MGKPIFTNNLWATLGAALTATATSISLAAGHGARFPTIAAGDWLYMTLCDANNDLEIVKVTARSGDTLTVLRAQDNTVARAWHTGDRIEARFVAAYLNEMVGAATAVLDAGGFTMTGFLTLKRDPVAGNMLATKQFVDNNYLPATLNYQPPIPYPLAQSWTNSIGLGWDGTGVYVYVDTTYVGRIWTSSRFNPGSYASVGATCPWQSTVVENGAINIYGASNFDNGSPWIMEGIRWGSSLNNAGGVIYARSTYLRNQ